MGRLWKQCWKEEGEGQLVHRTGVRQIAYGIATAFCIQRILTCHERQHCMHELGANRKKASNECRCTAGWIIPLFKLPALQIGILFPILVLDNPIQVARRVPSKIRDVKINHIGRHKIKDRVFHLHLI